ncbi:hypothetical protein FIBSPDRAFT_77817 [Athelia psychrophila]|uniref:Uncharacterized protein n=1 Tax=Athelia psychrophila TaxID=1759441 RepID=A0A166EBC6_9AGAM|nr:hypothetical protein FIBSPDRAFT_77817 [Fibularhizoctonia sp. CBS 109695]
MVGVAEVTRAQWQRPGHHLGVEERCQYETNKTVIHPRGGSFEAVNGVLSALHESRLSHWRERMLGRARPDQQHSRFQTAVCEV